MHAVEKIEQKDRAKRCRKPINFTTFSYAYAGL